MLITKCAGEGGYVHCDVNLPFQPFLLYHPSIQNKVIMFFMNGGCKLGKLGLLHLEEYDFTKYTAI